MTEFAKHNLEGSVPGNTGVTVRLARSSDLQAIATIAATGEDEDAAYDWTEAGKEIVLQYVGAALKVIFVAEAMSKVVGFARTDYFVPPDDAPDNCVPEGWYLRGLTVEPGYRGRGIGSFLTESRLSWLAGRTNIVRYFVSSENRGVIALHKKMGFKEARRDIWAPRVTVSDGVNYILYELSLQFRPAFKAGAVRA